VELLDVNIFLYIILAQGKHNFIADYIVYKLPISLQSL